MLLPPLLEEPLLLAEDDLVEEELLVIPVLEDPLLLEGVKEPLEVPELLFIPEDLVDLVGADLVTLVDLVGETLVDRVVLGAVVARVVLVERVGEAVERVDLVVLPIVEVFRVFLVDLVAVLRVLGEATVVVAVLLGEVPLLEYALLFVFDTEAIFTGEFAVANLPVEKNPGGQ